MKHFLRRWLYLYPLTAHNYYLRIKKRLPDEWFWADLELLQQGKYLPKIFRIIMGN